MWSDKQHGVKTLVRILKDANNFVLVTIYENYTSFDFAISREE